MKKVLIIAIVILSLLLAGLAGLIWYQGSHVFVEGTAYAKNAEVVDLRGQNISEAHYLTVQQALPDSRVIWDVPFQGGKASSDARSLAIASVQSEDIRMLKAYFPDLSAIDASACTDYAMLALLAGELPGCDVQYTVDLGTQHLTRSSWCWSRAAMISPCCWSTCSICPGSIPCISPPQI